MDQAGLKKKIRLAYQKAEMKGDTATMQRLLDLYEKYSAKPIDNLVAAVSNDAQLFRAVGLDADKDVSKMLDAKPEEIVKQYTMLKDPLVIENIDSWSQDKWRAMAKANGFSDVKEFINLLYGAKASYDRQKAWRSEEDKLYLPVYGRVNADNVVTRALGNAQDWVAKNFYRNAYEAGKRGEDDVGKYLVTDQALNTAAAALAPIGGPLVQAAIGAGLASANEAAGSYLSDASIDLKQIPLGAALGAFGGRAVGKTAGDVIKSSAGRLGLKPTGGTLEKGVFTLGNTFEAAAVDPTNEVKLLSKNANQWLKKNVDTKALDVINAEKVAAADKKAAIDKIIAEEAPPPEVIEWLNAVKKRINYIPIEDSWNAYAIKNDKDFWRRSLKNDLPTSVNVSEKQLQSMLNKNGANLDKYAIVDGQIIDRASFLSPEVRSPTMNEFEQWVKTIPNNEAFRRSWANSRGDDIVRTALKVGSQEYGSNRARKDSDLKSEVESIRKRKPEEYEKYMNGEASKLTYDEKMKIDALMKRGYEE